MHRKAILSTFKMFVSTYGDASLGILLLQALLPLLLTCVVLRFWNTVPDVKFPIYGMDKEQLLSYFFLTFAFKPQFNVTTPITELLWEGSIVRYYNRPLPLLYQCVVETIGREWLWKGLTFTLPLLLGGGYLGLLPNTKEPSLIMMSLFSFLLTIILGFIIDFIFSAISIRFNERAYIAYRIRVILVLLLSGQIIPLQLLPEWLRPLFILSPLGSLANAPLAIYLGMEPIPFSRIFLQIGWCVALGVLAVQVLIKAEERMVSQGG